jgi:hypothetical protein
MGNITDKVKEKVMGAKDKVTDTAEEAKDKITDTKDATYNEAGARLQEGSSARDTNMKDDPLTQYRDKEPMTPAKIKEHEPTAVKREMSEKISESGQTGTSSEEAAEKARRRQTAGAATDNQ